MPRYQLDLCLRAAEGALARVIGTVERRGFRPVGVEGRALAEAEAEPDGGWQLSLLVEGERPVEPLAAQLAKVYDCLAVVATPWTQAAGAHHD